MTESRRSTVDAGGGVSRPSDKKWQKPNGKKPRTMPGL